MASYNETNIWQHVVIKQELIILAVSLVFCGICSIFVMNGIVPRLTFILTTFVTCSFGSCSYWLIKYVVCAIKELKKPVVTPANLIVPTNMLAQLATILVDYPHDVDAQVEVIFTCYTPPEKFGVSFLKDAILYAQPNHSGL